MSRPSPEKVVQIIYDTEVVYDLDTDSRIREAANGMTARALMEMLSRFDDAASDFAQRVAEGLNAIGGFGPTALVGWDDGRGERDRASDSQPPKDPSTHFLKLVFSSADAAYFQFPLTPILDAPYICGAVRKREGAIQHIRLELISADHLQDFIESLRENPHFVRVEASTEDEFRRAPSNAI